MKRIVIALLLLMSMRLAVFGQTDMAVEKDYVGYLFVYFKGNHISDEAICYAVSTDGYSFYALNGNSPVIDSKVISSTGGVRDPHILRCRDGKTFYMVATDMVSDNGWDSNRAMVLLKSTDLVNWSHSVVNMQKRFSGQEKLKRVWAPQTIFDPEAGKYMIYWSMQYGDGPDVIYYAYANDDFTDVVDVPKPLFVPKDKKSCIDGDIVYKDGVFHLFYKTEGHGNGIKVATTRSLTSGNWIEYPDTKQQTTEAVEGAGTFKLIGEDKYILMYDVYMSGYYQFTESTDLQHFKVIDNKVQMDFSPRHGTVIPITRDEMLRVTGRWGLPSGLGQLPANPVLPGFHADPEVLYSKNTGRYYIYSTTDGFPGWGGWYFTAYSSSDLKNWVYEGIVLDLHADPDSWATGNAWAPCIEEKMVDGKYKYYFYYSAQPKAGGGKQIGVAVGDSPAGPFTDIGHPMISEAPNGVEGGQLIDVDVFTDPVSGKSYLYWGNGYMAGAELADDMVSIKPETTEIMTPKGGTLADYAYREAPYVIYRDGQYYFLWSVDDTGAANYHIAYGTSKSPLGKIKVAKKPVLLVQRPDKEIYGTGHCSVVNLPGTDDWRVVYHRINKHYLNDAPGVHREVCIDKLEFNDDGTIKPVEPTL